MIYTVTFNPALDYVVEVPEFEAGQLNRTAGDEIQLGGKGINVSTVLRNLGFSNVALGFIAGFTGQALVSGLEARGIQTDFIRLPAGHTRINVKIKGASETEINASGPSIPSEAVEALFEKLDKLQDGDVLVLAGSIPDSMPSDIYESILKRLSAKSILTAVDATKELLVNVLKYHPFVIKPNNHELGEIFGRELHSIEEITECARQLQEKGARNVLVSMAGDGALLLDETGRVSRMEALKGKVKNSVGAGDSMVAGFLAGYLERQDYSWALKMGSAAGSATAFSKNLATKREIVALLEKMK